MPSSNNLKLENSDSDLDRDNIEEIEASIFSKILKGGIAFAVIAGLIYTSGIYQHLLYRKTSPSISQTPIATRVDAEQLTVPLTIFIVLGDEIYGSVRSRENAINLVENASRIWDQAGIAIEIKNIYEIEKNHEEIRVFYDSPSVFFNSVDKFDPATINSFLVGNLNGINGLAFGGTRSIAVADYTTVYDFRAFAHEVGHILGLNHVSGSRSQLMYRGANGFDLSFEEIERARRAASAIFPGYGTDTDEKQTTEVRTPELPFLASVVQKELAPGETITFDGFQVFFDTEPGIPRAGVPVQLLWNIIGNDGAPVSLDTSIHRLPMHTYVLRSDLGSSLLHLHPRMLGLWSDSVTFSSGGLWHVVMQFAKNGTAYNIVVPLLVEGKKPDLFSPDFTRERELSGWTVRLQEVPEKIRVGRATALTFVVEGRRELLKSDLDGGHNVIFALQNEPFIWNMHGDRSVERISKDVGLPVERSVPTRQKPFFYTVTFPKPGLWLIHFEINRQSARFFVNVE